MWNDSMVFSPQAWPFFRSASVQRMGLDLDSVLQENIGGEQDLLTAVDGVRHVMEAALGSGGVLRIGEVVALVGAGHPHRRFDACIQDDLLSEAESQVVLEELAIGLDIDRQAVPVIQASDVAAARRKALGLILERRP